MFITLKCYQHDVRTSSLQIKVRALFEIFRTQTYSACLNIIAGQHFNVNLPSFPPFTNFSILIITFVSRAIHFHADDSLHLYPLQSHPDAGPCKKVRKSQCLVTSANTYPLSLQKWTPGQYLDEWLCSHGLGPCHTHVSLKV